MIGTAVSGTLNFPPNQTDEFFSVPILANPNRSTPTSSINLTLGQPSGGATLGAISSATVTIANQSNPQLVKAFLVVNTNDSGRARCGRRSPTPMPGFQPGHE